MPRSSPVRRQRWQGPDRGRSVPPARPARLRREIAAAAAALPRAPVASCRYRQAPVRVTSRCCGEQAKNFFELDVSPDQFGNRHPAGLCAAEPLLGCRRRVRSSPIVHAFPDSADLPGELIPAPGGPSGSGRDPAPAPRARPKSATGGCSPRRSGPATRPPSARPLIRLCRAPRSAPSICRKRARRA